MMVTFSLYEREDGKFVSHALDFDIVAVADSEKDSEEKLRLAVKIYIEYGLFKGWEKDIRFSAPMEFWDRLTPDSHVSIGPPIEITDARPQRRVIVYRAQSRVSHAASPGAATASALEACANSR
jgi:hypothetical protein